MRSIFSTVRKHTSCYKITECSHQTCEWWNYNYFKLARWIITHHKTTHRDVAKVENLLLRADVETVSWVDDLFTSVLNSNSKTTKISSQWALFLVLFCSMNSSCKSLFPFFQFLILCLQFWIARIHQISRFLLLWVMSFDKETLNKGWRRINRRFELASFEERALYTISNANSLWA